jgi:Ca-activated chloride channel homolog
MSRAARLALLGLTLVLVAGAAAAWPFAARLRELLSARWEHPWALAALLFVPIVLHRSTLGADRRSPRLVMGSLGGLATAPIGPRVLLRDVPGVLRAVGVACLALALARPINLREPETRAESGIDIILVLDLSGSMEAVLDNLPQDLSHLVEAKPRGERLTRLDGAKAVIRDFIARRETDRIGVVAFGKDAYVVSPPTLDYHLLDQLVARMQLRLIDGSGTAIGDAVGVAVARLRRSEARSKAVLLLTDGDNNAGQLDPKYAAHLATVVGAKLYTIQIGEGDEAVVQEGYDLFGNPRFIQRRMPTNPALLKELADVTGGASYVATDAAKLRASFHDVLDRLEKTQFQASAASYEELYRFWLLPGVLCVALEALLAALLLRRFP